MYPSNDGLTSSFREAADPRAALTGIVTNFASHPYTYSATAWVDPRQHDDGGAARIFRRPGRIVHVVGTSGLAEALRRLLRDGAVSPWQLHPVPEPGTFLERAESTLGHRAYHVLCRAGFETIEEVAATPDDGLLELRNLGTKSLAAIHAAVAEHLADAVTNTSGHDEHEGRRRRIADRVHPCHLNRHSEFLDRIARSRVPLEAVDTIVDSINAEAVPPADPMVILLLRTAGETRLADVYEAAHDPPPADASWLHYPDDGVS